MLASCTNMCSNLWPCCKQNEIDEKPIPLQSCKEKFKDCLGDEIGKAAHEIRTIALSHLNTIESLPKTEKLMQTGLDLNNAWMSYNEPVTSFSDGVTILSNAMQLSKTRAGFIGVGLIAGFQMGVILYSDDLNSKNDEKQNTAIDKFILAGLTEVCLGAELIRWAVKKWRARKKDIEYNKTALAFLNSTWDAITLSFTPENKDRSIEHLKKLNKNLQKDPELNKKIPKIGSYITQSIEKLSQNIIPDGWGLFEGDHSSDDPSPLENDYEPFIFNKFQKHIQKITGQITKTSKSPSSSLTIDELRPETDPRDEEIV